MSKIKWNGFFVRYPSATTFKAAVSSSLGKGMQFDRKMNKLPTPYALFCEWARINLSGDWASTAIKGAGFLIAVENQDDVRLVVGKFGVYGKSVGSREYQCGYTNSSYGRLAVSLGYDVEVK